MKKHKNTSLQNRTVGFHIAAEKQGNKKKSKPKNVTRLINEGDPSTQAGSNSDKENEGQGFQYQQEDPS